MIYTLFTVAILASQVLKIHRETVANLPMVLSC